MAPAPQWLLDLVSHGDDLTMPCDLTLPKLGFSMTEGILSEWMVNDGDEVAEGQIIYSLESEKSVQEIESPERGVIRIEAEAGQTYQVGDRLGRIE